jgi:hypothetical protein
MRYGKGPENNNSKQFSSGAAVFAQARLTNAEKELFASWRGVEAPETDEALTLLIDDDYRVSTKRDIVNACVQTTIINLNQKHRNHDLIIISRHDNVFDTIMLAFFKVFVLHPEERYPEEGAAADWG